MPVLVQHDPVSGVGRPVVGEFGLTRDDGLESAVFLSLFLDARAEPGDQLDDGDGGDKRGFWAETYGFVGGSRLWTLRRRKRDQVTLSLVESYSTEALKWLVDDRVAKDVTAVAQSPVKYPDRIDLTIDITRANGKRWQRYWEAVA